MFPLTVGAEKSSGRTLSNYLDEVRINNDIPAMAVAIITDGEISYTEGFGYLEESSTYRVTEKTLFRIASISKLFTAQAIMKLVEMNKLSLSDEVGLHLPAFKKSHITIKHLLTHTSGLNDQIKPVSFDQDRSITRYLNLVSNSVPTEIESGRFEYADTNFNLLGAVISTVTGQSYESFISEAILQPAHFKVSGFNDGKNSLFSETLPSHNGILLEKRFRRPYDLAFNPSEGLIASVHDLSRWVQLTLNKNSAILQQQFFDKMLEPTVKTVWGEIYMGLGWQVYNDRYGKAARHPGSIRGYKSLLITYPENKNALILLSNSSATPRWEIAKAITEIMRKDGKW